ncbi:ESCRT-III subunit protein VPS20 [Kockiozyma suomiensis]|uniref:ESCRT-III subunit protein VPS20 n=1 Tax=Kockiozyma suomiensis TaxID=1337062 RepID=UPI00334306D1
MGISSSRPSRRITKQDNAILNMKLQRDRLQQYQKRIQVVLDRERDIAKQYLEKGDKERALLALRKRKYQAQLLTKTDSQLETLEKLTQSIEFALVEKDVLFGLQQGNQVLKEINKEMSMDKVEKLLDESAAGIEYQNEISEMLADTITNAEEDEIEEELAALQREEIAKRIPSVPTADLPEQETENAEEESEEEERVSERNRGRRQPALAA